MSDFSKYEHLIAQLQGVRRDGDYIRAICPGHDDRKQSLSLWIGKDGRLMIGCHAGCQKATILLVMGWTWANLMPSSDRQRESKSSFKIAKTYDYLDESGRLLYQAVRMVPKDFRQRRPDGKGGWTWSLGDCRRVLYRLPELLAAEPKRLVWVLEGEKDVDNLRQAVGAVATTKACGAKSAWLDDYSLTLADRHVAIVPDNDTAGRSVIAPILGSLLRYGARSVRIIELGGLGEHGDMSDWLSHRQHRSPEEKRAELKELVAASECYASQLVRSNNREHAGVS